MRGQTGRHGEGLEGQGEVIQIVASPVPLSALDASPALLQSGFWGAFKQEHGWRALGFSLRADGDTPWLLLVLTRSLARRFTIAYVPFGPMRDPGPDRWAMLRLTAQALRPHLPAGTLALRFDLPWPRCGDGPAPGLAPGIVKARYDVQPAATVVVDIARPLEAVMAAMKPKTRYNIRRATRKGVTVTQAGPLDFDPWYELYRETARRDRIGIHAPAYYRDLLAAPKAYAGVRPDIRLLLARHEGALLAGNIVAFWREQAVYLYGASSGEQRNLMPTYALQWEAIRMAREEGCTSYDLFGVPPRPDPVHPLYGLFQFKTGFGDAVLERWGTWDVPLNGASYGAWRAAEGLRMFYYRNLKKRLRTRHPGGIVS